MGHFKKITIIGIGLIGGSVGLAARKKGLAGEVTGIGRDIKKLRLACKLGAIDSFSLNYEPIKNSDLVVLAVPVGVMPRIAAVLKKFIKKDCLVIDVGSTKDVVTRQMGRMLSGFVGCHPMAGSEKSGVKFASPSLFEGSTCILTPVKNTHKLSFQKAKKFWESLGCRTVVMEPRVHDVAVSYISHLPHVLAYALVNSVPSEFIPLASGGLKDTTRIAASDPALWSDIILANKNNLLKSLSVFKRELRRFENALERANKESLTRFLAKAKKKRAELK